MYARKLEAGRIVGKPDLLKETAVLFILAFGLVGKTETGEIVLKQLHGGINGKTTQ